MGLIKWDNGVQTTADMYIYIYRGFRAVAIKEYFRLGFNFSV